MATFREYKEEIKRKRQDQSPLDPQFEVRDVDQQELDIKEVTERPLPIRAKSEERPRGPRRYKREYHSDAGSSRAGKASSPEDPMGSDEARHITWKIAQDIQQKAQKRDERVRAYSPRTGGQEQDELEKGEEIKWYEQSTTFMDPLEGGELEKTEEWDGRPTGFVMVEGEDSAIVDFPKIGSKKNVDQTVILTPEEQQVQFEEISHTSKGPSLEKIIEEESDRGYEKPSEIKGVLRVDAIPIYPMTDFYIPCHGFPRISEITSPERANVLTETGHPAAIIFITDWRETYGTVEYRIDRVTGEIHAKKGEKWQKIDKKGLVFPEARKLSFASTPGEIVAGRGEPKSLGTVTKSEPRPVAESTRTDEQQPSESFLQLGIHKTKSIPKKVLIERTKKIQEIVEKSEKIKAWGREMKAEIRQNLKELSRRIDSQGLPELEELQNQRGSILSAYDSYCAQMLQLRAFWAEADTDTPICERTDMSGLSTPPPEDDWQSEHGEPQLRRYMIEKAGLQALIYDTGIIKDHLKETDPKVDDIKGMLRRQEMRYMTRIKQCNVNIAQAELAIAKRVTEGSEHEYFDVMEDALKEEIGKAEKGKWGVTKPTLEEQSKEREEVSQAVKSISANSSPEPETRISQDVKAQTKEKSMSPEIKTPCFCCGKKTHKPYECPQRKQPTQLPPEATYVQKVENWLETGMSPWGASSVEEKLKSSKFSDPEVSLTPHRLWKKTYKCRGCEQEHLKGNACEGVRRLLENEALTSTRVYVRCLDCGLRGHDGILNHHLCPVMKGPPSEIEVECKYCGKEHDEKECPMKDEKEEIFPIDEHLRSLIDEFREMAQKRKQNHEYLNDMRNCLAEENKQMISKLDEATEELEKTDQKQKVLIQKIENLRQNAKEPKEDREPIREDSYLRGLKDQSESKKFKETTAIKEIKATQPQKRGGGPGTDQQPQKREQAADEKQEPKVMKEKPKVYERISLPKKKGKGDDSSDEEKRPPKKPLPEDKKEKDKEEEDDDDPTIVTESSTQPQVKWTWMKTKRKSKRKRPKKKPKGGGGGDGSSPPSSDDEEQTRSSRSSDSQEEEIPLLLCEKEGRRGKMGQRGRRGIRGPQGPQGPPGVTPPLPKPILKEKMELKPEESMRQGNVTMNTSSLEKSIMEVSNSLRNVFHSQQNINVGIKEQLEESIKEQQENNNQLKKLVDSNNQRGYDSLHASIPIYDGADIFECEPWIERLEIACMISGREIQKEALARSTGGLNNALRGIGVHKKWEYIKAEIRRNFGVHKTRIHFAYNFAEIEPQRASEPLRSFIHRYNKLHYEATKKPASQELDLTKKVTFLVKLRNTSITNKIVKSKEFLRTNQYSLRDCFQKALELETQFQYCEGINIARTGQVMEVDSENVDSEVFEQIEAIRAGTPTFNRVNSVCYRCGQKGHYARDCTEGVDNNSVDDKSPHVGKIQHTLQAETPVTHQMITDLMKKAVNAEVKSRIYKAKNQKLQKQIQTTTYPAVLGPIITPPSTTQNGKVVTATKGGNSKTNKKVMFKNPPAITMSSTTGDNGTNNTQSKGGVVTRSQTKKQGQSGTLVIGEILGESFKDGEGEETEGSCDTDNLTELEIPTDIESIIENEIEEEIGEQ